MTTPIIDTHQHLWDPSARSYDWLDESAGPLFRTFGPEEIEPQLRQAGVDFTILVQAADTYEDTFSMLSIADTHEFVAGVVGWVPLDRADEAAAALDRLATHPKFVGMRHLIHIYPDTDWVVSQPVIDGLRLLAERDLIFEMVAVIPRHLEHVPTITAEIPELRIVIDHLAKPPIADRGWQPWADLITRAAEAPNVAAKISGLNTAADLGTWSASDLQPYVDHALEVFGPERLMFGGDWPISTLAGTYQQVWDATLETLDGLDDADRAAVLGGTAQQWYSLPVAGD